LAVVVPGRGQFRHIIKLENPAKTSDGAGGQSEQYLPFCTTRGHMEKRTGFRNLEEGYDQLVSEWRGFLVWRNSFDAYIRKDTRLIYDNRVFKILNKEVVDQKRMIYMFTLIEVE